MGVLDDIKARLGYIPTSQLQMEHELGNEGMQLGKPQPVKPAEEKSGTVAGTDGQKQLTYEQMFEMTNPYGDLQKKKEDLEKKRKRDAMFAALGDGFNAFHQAYAYSRGIKPLTENKSQSKAVQDKYDKLFGDLDTKKLAYMREKMNAMRYDQQEQNRLEELQFKKEQAKKAFDYQVKKDEEAKEERERKDKQAQDNWQSKFDAEQKDKEERRNNQKDHYERQDRNAANRNANSGKKQATTGNGKKRNPMSNGKKKNPMN